jgi:hypothetical protein
MCEDWRYLFVYDRRLAIVVQTLVTGIFPKFNCVELSHRAIVADPQ